MAGSITVSGMSAGELTGERIIGPMTIVGKAVIGETIVASLVEGPNNYTVPTEATAVLIVPPPNNENELRVRTNRNQSDSGLPINPTPWPFVYPLASGTTTLTVLSEGISTGLYILFI